MNKTGRSSVFFCTVLMAGAVGLTSFAFAQLGKPTKDDMSLRQRRLPFSMPAPEPTAPQDLNGYWKLRLNLPPAGAVSGPRPPPQPGAVAPGPAAPSSAAMQKRLQCIPDFAPWGSTEGAPDQFVQTPKMIMILFEEFHKSRKIHLEGDHPKDLKPSYAGDSVGHWEGDTLVVDTVGIKGSATSGGPDAKPTLHLRERITKIEGGKVLEDLMSYYDTNGGDVPPDQRVVLDWVGGPPIMEWVCEDAGKADLENNTTGTGK